MNVQELLFALIRHTVCKETIDDTLTGQITSENLPALFRLAARHDLLHLVGHAFKKLGILAADTTVQDFERHARRAVFRYARIIHDYEQICGVLENTGIAYIPLKGSVLRNWYPEPWMRTSCDIDILVKETDLENAASALIERLHFFRGGKGHHDISMHSPNGIHLELHYNADNPEHFSREKAVLGQIWEYAELKKNTSYQYVLTDDMFYFYHITHMAKHMYTGGCGIRPFLDLWILNHRVTYDRAARELILQQGGMLQFAQAAEALAEVWFSCSDANALSTALEEYIFSGGIYGSTENDVAAHQPRQGGKLRFLLGKIFPSFQMMCCYYPVLQKKPWLLPVYMIRRWFRLIFSHDAKRALRTMHINASVSQEKISTVASLMQQLGLQK